LLLLLINLCASLAMALHARTSDALFLVESQPGESGKVSLALMNAFLFLALEAASNMFPYIVFLCSQVGDAEMTECKRWAGKKDTTVEDTVPVTALLT
jgi:hypothetical protein